MPIWFTVEEERPDIGTVIFKADDYYERLQHITGMWNDSKYLYHDIDFHTHSRRPPDLDQNVNKWGVDPNKHFTLSDVKDVPTLLAFLDRANLKGVLPPTVVEFMWDMEKLYANKMAEFGYPTTRMSKKEYSLLENHDRWDKLVNAIEGLRLYNLQVEAEAKRMKRKLLPATFRNYTRMDNLPPLNLAEQHGSEEPHRRVSASRQSRRASLAEDGIRTDLDKHNQLIVPRPRPKKFFIRYENQNPFAWDFGKTRLFDRKHVRIAGKHIEFTRFYHKIAKALRFSKCEPVDWRTIQLEEVDKHKYLNDCWMVIKGRVYDVTNYLKLHPGGSHLVMKGAGKDATSMFVSVHRHVVFYKELPRMQIGTLPDFEEHCHTQWEDPAYFDIFRTLREWFCKTKPPVAKYKPTTKFYQDDTHYIYTVTFPRKLVSTEDDWSVTITKGFQVTVIKFIDPPYVWYGGFDLRKKVVDDTAYREFSEDCNSLKLKIAKPYKRLESKAIKDWRQNHNFFLSSYALTDMFRASVVERTKLVEGVKLYGIAVGLNKYLGCPLGCYVNLRILDEMRPYTPICLPDEFEKKFVEDSGEFQTLYFMIKEFKDGDFTPMLHYLPVKRILKGVDLFISPPMGNFKSSFLFDNMDFMLLIAGGTGIAPMTRIIQEYIQKNDKLEKKHVTLIIFAEDREDIIWFDAWKKLNRKYTWFHFYYSLTRVYRFSVDNQSEGAGDVVDGVPVQKEPTIAFEIDRKNPHELFGYPSAVKLDHVYRHVYWTYRESDSSKQNKACVCGPAGFNQSCEDLLNGYGKHKEDDVYYFAG